MGAVAHLESRLVAVTPGSQGTVQLRVRNNGSVVDQFTFQVLGDAQPWATVAPPSLSLFPGAEESATITFAPPRSSQAPAGQMPFGVHIISKEDAQGSVVEEGVVDIAPFSDVFAELAPRTSRGRRAGTHDLAIDNRGNAPLNANLSAIDADRLLNFEVKPPGVVAEPGTAAFAKIAVQPKRSFWRGPSRTHPFQVLLDGAGPTPVTVDGTMVQESILPSWFMRAVLLVIAALIALILLWLFLIKPAIQSTAQTVAADQTAAMLAAVGITPPPGGFPTPGVPPNNGGPSTAPASPGGPTGSPTTGNVPSAPPLTGGGQPTDGLIIFGKDALTVPAGRTLFITDLVFSNPNPGSVGGLSLQRSGQTLLALRVENFRNLDFHFVTPIVVPENGQLGLACDTQGACDNTSVYYSGYQR